MNFSFNFNMGASAMGMEAMSYHAAADFDVVMNNPPQACALFLEQVLRSVAPRLIAMGFLDDMFLMSMGMGLEPEMAAQHVDVFYHDMKAKGLDDDAANFLLSSMEESCQFMGDLFMGMRSRDWGLAPPMVPLSSIYIGQEVMQAAQRLQMQGLIDFNLMNLLNHHNRPDNGLQLADMLYSYLRIRGTVDDAGMFLRTLGPDFRLVSLLFLGMAFSEIHHATGMGQFGHMYNCTYQMPPPQLSVIWNW